MFPFVLQSRNGTREGEISAADPIPFFNQPTPILGPLQSKPLLGPENSNDALRVHDPVCRDPAEGTLEGDRMDLKELRGVMVACSTGYKPQSQEELNRASGEANGGIEGAKLDEPLGAEPDFLLALPASGGGRSFAMVDDPGRDLVDRPPDRQPVLPNEVETSGIIDRDDCHGVRGMDDVPDRLSAIGEDNRLLLCREVVSGVDHSLADDSFDEFHFASSDSVPCPDEDKDPGRLCQRRPSR